MVTGNVASPSHFDFFIIDNTKYLQDSYALRYKIYCEETGFLREEDYPDKREEDVFDDFAIHVGAVNKVGLLVGTVRMVLPSRFGFPLVEHCEFFDEYKSLDLHENPLFINVAEISRLALVKSYRRRSGDGLFGTSDNTNETSAMKINKGIIERRHRPEIVLGLYKTLYQESKRRGITAWFAAMEKTLLRLLHRYEFGFKPIGPEVDYYGPVTPYLAKIADLELGVRQKYPDLFLTFAEGLESDYLD